MLREKDVVTLPSSCACSVFHSFEKLPSDPNADVMTFRYHMPLTILRRHRISLRLSPSLSS